MELPSFKEIGLTLNEWNDTRFEHKKSTDKMIEMAISAGLEKSFTSDARMAFCFLRGIMLSQRILKKCREFDWQFRSSILVRGDALSMFQVR